MNAERLILVYSDFSYCIKGCNSVFICNICIQMLNLFLNNISIFWGILGPC